MSHQHLSTEIAFPSSCGSCYTSQQRSRNSSVWILSHTRAREMEMASLHLPGSAAAVRAGSRVPSCTLPSRQGGTDRFCNTFDCSSQGFQSGQNTHERTREVESSCLVWISTGVMCLEGKWDLQGVLLGCVPLACPLPPGKTRLQTLISSQVVTFIFFF